MTDRPYLRAPFRAALDETRLEHQLAASLLASLDRCGACGGEVGQPAHAVPLGQWDDQGREFWDRCSADVHCETMASSAEMGAAREAAAIDWAREIMVERDFSPMWGSTHPAFLGLTDYPTA